MPRPITNLLRQGLPSKMYFLAYPEPISIYAIAKKIYGLQTNQPQHLYKWRDRLKSEGYLEEKKGKWLSTSKPLFEEIINRAKERNKELNSDEERLVKSLLDSDMFRRYVRAYNPDVAHEFDGFENLITIFDLMMLQWIQVYRTNKKIQSFRVTTIEESVKYMNLYKKNKSKKDIKKDIEKGKSIVKEQLGHFPSDLGKLDSLNISRNLEITLFPRDLMYKLQGISAFGQIYLLMFDGISQHLELFIKSITPVLSGKGLRKGGFRNRVKY